MGVVSSPHTTDMPGSWAPAPPRYPNRCKNHTHTHSGVFLCCPSRSPPSRRPALLAAVDATRPPMHAGGRAVADPGREPGPHRVRACHHDGGAHQHPGGGRGACRARPARGSPPAAPSLRARRGCCGPALLLCLTCCLARSSRPRPQRCGLRALAVAASLGYVDIVEMLLVQRDLVVDAAVSDMPHARACWPSDTPGSWALTPPRCPNRCKSNTHTLARGAWCWDGHVSGMVFAAAGTRRTGKGGRRCGTPPSPGTTSAACACWSRAAPTPTSTTCSGCAAPPPLLGD